MAGSSAAQVAGAASYITRYTFLTMRAAARRHTVR
jgi:hypothetical protein